VIARCPWWKYQSTVLQTKEKWMRNAIVGLKWSGPSATSELAKLLIVQAKQQSFGVTLYNSKSFECREIVTVSHGNAQLEEVMIAVEAYYSELGFNAPRPPYMLELTVVSRDEGEYQEISLPIHWERSDIHER